MKVPAAKQFIVYLKLNFSKYFHSKPRQLALILFIAGILFTFANYRIDTEKINPRWYAFNDSLLPPGDKSQKYVVNTPTCKIPEMNPYDPSIRRHRYTDDRPVRDCKGTHRAWFVLNGTSLKINSSALYESGFTMESIFCCYRTIARVNQPLYNYNMDADNKVKFSEECHPITNGSALIDAGFIRVHCISNSTPFLWEVVYRDYFAVASPDIDRHVKWKISTAKMKWGGARGKTNHSDNSTFSFNPPPNVMIIGLDTVSRMNAYRHLPKTLELLRSLGAVELFGYNTIGESTWQNVRAFMSGYTYGNLWKLCYRSDAIGQDDCPYIWKAFDALGYLTVHAEDTPGLSIFNYKKAGFIRRQVDYYIRILMLAVKAHTPRIMRLSLESILHANLTRDYMYTGCIGQKTAYEFIFNYLLDIVQLGKIRSVPVFALSWITNLAHKNYNNLQFADDAIVNLIQRLIQISEDNTIFFFVSDHGLRYGKLRTTVQGWYEVKLPTHFVYLPHRVRKQFPSWQQGLELNSHKLTSPYDLHKTMVHILQTFNGNLSSIQSHFFKNISSQYGQSLFTPVPLNRTCSDAGVDLEYCPCFSPKPMDISSPVILLAAQAAVHNLAKRLPLDVCAMPTLREIVSGGYLDNPQRPGYLLTFYTSPGNFLFEVIVEKGNSSEELVVKTDFLRLNAIDTNTKCVKTYKLETICYCL